MSYENAPSIVTEDELDLDDGPGVDEAPLNDADDGEPTLDPEIMPGSASPDQPD